MPDSSPPTPPTKVGLRPTDRGLLDALLVAVHPENLQAGKNPAGQMKKRASQGGRGGKDWQQGLKGLERSHGGKSRRTATLNTSHVNETTLREVTLPVALSRAG